MILGFFLALFPVQEPLPLPRAYEIADFYGTAFVGAPSLCPMGERVAFAVQRYDLEESRSWSEIWMASADGSNLRQMTRGRHSDNSPCFSADGSRLLFVSTRDGSPQIYSMPVDGGEPCQLTDFPPGVGDPQCSPDGKFIAVTSAVFPECGIDAECNKKLTKDLAEGLQVHLADELLYRHWTEWSEGRRTHILLLSAETGEVLLDATPGEFDAPTFMLGGGRGFCFGPDGRSLCYVRNAEKAQAESTNADLWLLDLDEEIDPANAVNLTAANRGWDGAPLFSPDGSSIAFISQEGAGYEADLKRLAVLDLEAGEVRYLTDRQGFDDMVEDMRWTPRGDALIFQAQVKGRTPLYRVNVESGEIQELLSDAHIGGWELAPDGSFVVYSRRSVGEPSELYRVVFPGGERTALSHFNAKLRAEVDIRPVEELWVQGEADYRVHVFLVKPHGFDPSRRYPLILNVHGGPQMQWTDSYRGDWQVYPGKGYVVAFANPTGSTGYGQDFIDAIACDWGGRVFRDLMKVTDELSKLSFVDPERMGAMGWSYGGYMMMWFQGQTERFRALASMMGLFDLDGFYGATEELWFPEKDLCGVPWESEHYEQWCPSNHVERFKTPSLVITGELDYRVPYTQSLMYFTALQKRGVPSRLVVFPEAGHWPGWREMLFYYNVHLDWFHRWLGGEPAPYDLEKLARNRVFVQERKP